jgi:hypothetical protein
MVQPIANLVIVQRFARRTFYNLTDNLFDLLLCQRTIPRVVLGALDCKADFLSFRSFVSGSFGRTVLALLAFERFDCDLR